MATATSTGSWLDPPELHGKRNSDGTFTLEELELKRLNDYNRKVAKMIQGGLNLANLNAAANQVFTDIQGNVTELSITAEGLATSVSNLSGDVSTLEQTASGLTTTVSNLSGDVSSVSQTVSGLGVTTSGGTTYITGDHVKTGTLEGVKLITDSSGYRTIIDKGWLEFFDGTTKYGSLSIQDALGKMKLSTKNGVDLIVESDWNMDVISSKIMELTSGGVMKLSAGAICPLSLTGRYT